MVIKITAIKYKQMRPRVILDAIRTGIARENEIQKRMFEKTVATWRNKPTFKTDVIETAGTLRGEVSTDDKIYGYINNGTRVRHALMSKNFRAKTKYRTIGSGAGSGRMIFVSRKIRRPGIRAREFAEEIGRRRHRPYLQNMERAINQAANRIF